MKDILDLHQNFCDQLFATQSKCDWSIIDKYLLKYLQEGNYRTEGLLESEVDIVLTKNNKDVLAMVVEFKYFEGDCIQDNDYFSGTGAFTEVEPASVSIIEVNFFKDDSPVLWQTSKAVDDELEAIILNLKN